MENPMFTTASSLAQRLSEVEKIQIRGANPGRLDWLFYNIYQYEIALPKEKALQMFYEVQEYLLEKFKVNSQATGFGATWAF
jgi:hypothetical protein